MDQFTLRLDHQFSRQDSAFGRFSFFNVDAYQPFGTGQLNESIGRGEEDSRTNWMHTYIQDDWEP
jgi:hypothetical protein